MKPSSQYMPSKSGLFLGVAEGHVDPAVAIVQDGRVLAFVEEERLTRIKHAPYLYPENALRHCLAVAGATISDIEAVAINWDIERYSNGYMENFYSQMRREYSVDSKTIAWQDGTLRRYNKSAVVSRHQFQWRRLFGDVRFPPIIGLPHHYVHAYHAALQSKFEKSLVITLDGSGDDNCTVVWVHEGDALRELHAIKMPHSLGWFYSAFTEYLGFEAYDGEYKVMGLAAYGKPNAKLQELVGKVLETDAAGGRYKIDPEYLHYGVHSFSDRFTDNLNALFGRPPRLKSEPVSEWHIDLAYAVQHQLETAVVNLVRSVVKETGIGNICISGGVAHNVKMNSRVFELSEVEDVFPQPLANDGGAAVGAALVACHQSTGQRPQALTTLATGPEDSDEVIRTTLERDLIAFEEPSEICAAVAGELAAGRIVGWFQGRMEGGPRALGQRSILADPRSTTGRDKVNAIVKFREDWRPFCPSIAAEDMPKFFEHYTDAPFMIMAFQANNMLAKLAPGIVHVDGTARVQMVCQTRLPLYHKLLKEFEKLAGIPILLNTSFNIKGEPVVCSVQDAIRTFWATGLEVLAVGRFLIRKTALRQN